MADKLASSNAEMLDELKEMREKVDKIFDMLGTILIPAETLTKIKNLNENTISRNNRIEKYNEPGKRKLLIKLESVNVIKNRKKSRSGAKSSVK